MVSAWLVCWPCMDRNTPITSLCMPWAVWGTSGPGGAVGLAGACMLGGACTGSSLGLWVTGVGSSRYPLSSRVSLERLLAWEEGGEGLALSKTEPQAPPDPAAAAVEARPWLLLLDPLPLAAPETCWPPFAKSSVAQEAQRPWSGFCLERTLETNLPQTPWLRHLIFGTGGFPPLLLPRGAGMTN